MAVLAAVALLGVLSAALPASAQVVTGRVTDELGAPVPGALVAFLDVAGDRVAGALSLEDGSYRAPLPRPGTYQVRIERIGYQLFERAGVVVPGAGLGGLDLRLASRAIRLEDVVVDPGRACTVRPADAELVSVIWEEARKALSGAAWAREAGLLNFRLATWERRWKGDGDELEEEKGDTLWVRSARPFHAAPPDVLDAEGWVIHDGEESVFHGPDEGALLSAVFQDRHCFRLTERDAPMEGLIGLAFQPLADRVKPDIEGVFWLDRATGELRSLDFRYTHVLLASRKVAPGGRMTFARLPTGAWIVRKWSIRVPVYRVNRVHHQMEAGGEVLAVDAVTGGG